MRQTAVWEIIKAIEGLDSQDGIDSLTENRQKFIRKDRAGNGGQERKLTKEEREFRKQVRVLYSSEDILVFHKPAGMLSQRAKASDDSLNDYLIDYCIQTGIISKEELAGFRPSIANRLDRNTSGIVLAEFPSRTSASGLYVERTYTWKVLSLSCRRESERRCPHRRLSYKRREK